MTEYRKSITVWQSYGQKYNGALIDTQYQLLRFFSSPCISFLATGYTRPRRILVASCNNFSPVAQIATSFTQGRYN